MTIARDPQRDGERRTFLDGSSRAVVRLETDLVGHGIYRPGWRWSQHAGPQTGRAAERHLGYLLSGAFIVEDESGSRVRVDAGQAFEVGPGHDAWVAGDEPCVALDVGLLGQRVASDENQCAAPSEVT